MIEPAPVYFLAANIIVQSQVETLVRSLIPYTERHYTFDIE